MIMENPHLSSDIIEGHCAENRKALGVEPAKEQLEVRRSAAACSIFDRECCPLCGGKSGFTYRATIRGTQFMPWKNGEGNAFFADSDSKHGAYRCDDCGKVIRSNDNNPATGSQDHE